MIYADRRVGVSFWITDRALRRTRYSRSVKDWGLIGRTTAEECGDASSSDGGLGASGIARPLLGLTDLGPRDANLIDDVDSTRYVPRLRRQMRGPVPEGDVNSTVLGGVRCL